MAIVFQILYRSCLYPYISPRILDLKRRTRCDVFGVFFLLFLPHDCQVIVTKVENYVLVRLRMVT